MKLNKFTQNFPLSIVSPAYNNGAELEGLLDSLKDDFERNPNLEMIVVDDCSPNESVRQTAEKYDFVRFIRSPQNKGAAGSRNIGARAASHDVIVFVDSDTQVEKDAITKVEEIMSNEEIKIMVGNKSKIPANKGIFPAYRAIMHNSWVPKEQFATFFTGAFGVMRKEVFEGMGGFDESYKGASVEDFEFGHRLSEKYKIHFFKDILVRVNWNLFGKTMETHFARTILWMQLFKKRKKFDNFCATPSQGGGYILGFLSVLLSPLLLFGGKYMIIAFSLFFSYLVFNRAFFILTAKEKGVGFMVMAIIIHLAESVVVTTGCIVGLFSKTHHSIKL